MDRKRDEYRILGMTDPAQVEDANMRRMLHEIQDAIKTLDRRPMAVAAVEEEDQQAVEWRPEAATTTIIQQTGDSTAWEIPTVDDLPALPGESESARAVYWTAAECLMWGYPGASRWYGATRWFDEDPTPS